MAVSKTAVHISVELLSYNHRNQPVKMSSPRIYRGNHQRDDARADNTSTNFYRRKCQRYRRAHRDMTITKLQHSAATLLQ